MKQKPRTNHKKRNIVLIVLLALLCVCGAELTACRFFAPDLYERIVSPVRRTASAAVELCVSAAQSAVQSAQDLGQRLQESLAARSTPEPEPEPESQMAGDPTLTDVLPVSDPSITELVLTGGQFYLTGGTLEIVYFNQGDEPWASQPYGSDKIGGYGCGPTAMAMVVASMTDTQTDPALMSQWAVDQGYWARRSGSYLSIVEGTAQAHGLQAESFPGRTPDELLEELLSGKVLVALMGPGHFTNRGHFILLRGVTLSGQVLVADPNSAERSLSVWDPQLILDELSKSTNNGAPLWSIAQPETPTGVPSSF